MVRNFPDDESSRFINRITDIRSCFGLILETYRSNLRSGKQYSAEHFYLIGGRQLLPGTGSNRGNWSYFRFEPVRTPGFGPVRTMESQYYRRLQSRNHSLKSFQTITQYQLHHAVPDPYFLMPAQVKLSSTHTYLAQGNPRSTCGIPQEERPYHCTSIWLTPAIALNMGNSGASFLVVQVFVRANPF